MERPAADAASVPSSPPPLTHDADDERLLRTAVRDFAETAVRPLVRDMDERAEIPRALIDRLFALGIMGVEIPASIGGSGRRFFHGTIAIEELARVDPAVAVLVDVQNTLVINAIRRWGRPPAREGWLRRLATSSVGAYALSEETSGSDAFALRTQARADGDSFVLDGRKLWITNAREADIFLVFATVDPGARHRGITAFVVDRATTGLSVGTTANKLGIRAASTCELVLDGCRVPRASVLGDVGLGYKVAIETLNEGRIGIGAQMLGLAEGALAAAMAHAKSRHQFGQPVVDFQGVRFQLARAATEIEAARLLVYNAARARDAGESVQREGAMCKLFASEVAERVASLAVNLCGARGFVREGPAEKFYRDAKVGQIYEGTSNLQLETIAKLLLA